MRFLAVLCLVSMIAVTAFGTWNVCYAAQCHWGTVNAGVGICGCGDVDGEISCEDGLLCTCDITGSVTITAHDNCDGAIVVNESWTGDSDSWREWLDGGFSIMIVPSVDSESCPNGGYTLDVDWSCTCDNSGPGLPGAHACNNVVSVGCLCDTGCSE